MAKITVDMPNSEQRLITFDTPNKDCTVQDLLEQANITIGEDTVVSLVSDSTSGINYIVKVGPGTQEANIDIPEHNEKKHRPDGENSSSQSFSTPDENSNSSLSQHKNSYKKIKEQVQGGKIEKDGTPSKRKRGRSRPPSSKPMKAPEDGLNAIKNYPKDPAKIQQTSLRCRTVRVGSYKYAPRDEIVVSHHGIRLRVPLLKDDKNIVTLDVKIPEIMKVLVHFGKVMPVLFIYTEVGNGANIRKLLGMEDPRGPYYDPAGREHIHKKITLLPEKVSGESKAVLKNIFAPLDLLAELSFKEANAILVRSSRKDNCLSIKKRQSLAAANSSVNGGIQK